MTKNQPQPPIHQGWSQIGPYAVISLVCFMLGAVLLFFMNWNAEKLVALGLTGRLYYVVLLPLGLAVAGFLFGVVQSVATYTGQQFGGKLVLGGPVVAFLLVVVLGFILVPDPSTFPVTFYVHGPDGPHDIILSNKGEVFVDLGGDRRKVSIGDQGQAYFPAIPESFRGQEVLAWVSADGFEDVDPNKRYRFGGPAVYLAVRRKPGRIAGLVESGEPKCITGARIQVAGLTTRVNPDSGQFELSVPGDRLKSEFVLDVTAPGCVSQHLTVVPDSNDTSITLEPVVRRKMSKKE